MNDIQKREKEESEIITIGKITPERQQKREVENALAENREMMQEKREEQKKEEQKTDSQLFIINQAKIKMNSHIGTFKVLNDVPTIQDKPVGTIVEKNPANFSFLDGFQVLSVIGDWQDTGTAKYQDNNALIKKSTLMVTGKMPPPSAPIETGKIEFIDSGQINVIEKINTSGIPAPENENPDFDIKISLCKDGYSTVVPMGILDFENKYENAFFAFEYTLSSNDIDKLTLEIIDENDKTIYGENYVPEVIIPIGKKENVRTSLEKGLKEFLKREGKPSRIWEWMEVYRDFNISKNDYTKPGHYILFWNGFDIEGIYDSSIFDKKTFRARLTGTKGEKKKTAEVSFRTEYAEVNWVDVRIDQNNKRIDTTLRVNLKDGGAEIGDYHQVSEEAISFYGYPPISYQATSYKDIERYVLEGISQFWSRHVGNIGKGVKVNEELYEVIVEAKVNKEGLAAPKIVYQTNVKEGRSRNWELSRILYFYEGYLYDSDWNTYTSNSIIYKNKGWYYRSENEEDEKNIFKNMPPLIEDFKMTSAHEIGHEILVAFGGHAYSKRHKGSSTLITQEVLPSELPFPKIGEIDLMKYYKNYYDIPRTIASEIDVLGLVWLTKIKIK